MNPFRSPALAGAAAAGLFLACASWFGPAGASEPTPAPLPVAEPPPAVEPCQDPPAQPVPPPLRCGLEVIPPRIEVMFVVDTTGSMGGLIEGAKRKVWSIANEILSGEPRPRVSVGLVAYRDRGDDYVTRITQPTEDLDAVYQSLMAFQADGGGDTPEHVNRALHETFTRVQWSADAALKLVYLVGDAPAQRAYEQELAYEQTIPAARQGGIVVNAVLCGGDGGARADFQRIARLGGGEFFEIEQSGGMIAAATPMDEELRRLQRELERTRLSYGSRVERKRAELRRKEVLAMDGEAAACRAAAVSKMAPAAAPGAGDDLIAAFREGRLAEVEDEALPEALQVLSAEERAQQLNQLSEKRAALETQLRELAEQRDAYLREKAPADGFDARVLESVKNRAKAAGIRYR